MSSEKMYCNESRKSLSQQLLVKVSLRRFHFASALYYFYYNEHSAKQTALLYLKLPLKPGLCFCYFWKDKISLCFF